MHIKKIITIIQHISSLHFLKPWLNFVRDKGDNVPIKFLVIIKKERKNVYLVENWCCYECLYFCFFPSFSYFGPLS